MKVFKADVAYPQYYERYTEVIALINEGTRGRYWYIVRWDREPGVYVGCWIAQRLSISDPWTEELFQVPW